MGLHQFLLLTLLSFAAPLVRAGDPDILSDFVVPSTVNASQIDGTFFTFTNLINEMDSADMTKFSVAKASMAEFPALNGQSVSFAGLMYPPGTVNPPHIHPRASELLYVVEGPLFVGLIDATNKTLYNQTLQTGDMFVFPKGMVHFQYNQGDGMVRAFSAFGSASPGTISLPVTLFETNIDNTVLAMSFKTDEATIQSLKNDLVVPAAPEPAPAPPSSSAMAITALLSPSILLLCFGIAFL